MTEDNPYATPQTDAPSALHSDSRKLEKIASAQKLAIFAAMAYLALIPIKAVLAHEIIYALIAVSIFIFVVFTAARINRALGVGWFMTIIGIVVMIIPLVGLLVLLNANRRATTRLRAGGYEVGFLGAKPPGTNAR